MHNWVLFFLWFCLFILSGVVSPLISSSILGTYRPGEFIFLCPIFLPFHTLHRVLKARSGFPFPSPVDHILSLLSPWHVHFGWPFPAWLLISLTRLWYMWSDWLVFCDCVFQPDGEEKDKRLMEASWWERLTEGKLGLVLIGGAMLSKSLIQFSFEGWGCVPSLLFDLRPNYGGGNEDNGDLLQKVPCRHWYTQCP